jgi:hypothetical protein
MSALMWCAPSSCSTSLIALKIGRSGQPVQKPGGRAWTWAASVAGAIAAGAIGRSPARGAVALEERAQPVADDAERVLAGARQQVLAVQRGRRVAVAKHRRQGLLDEVGLPFLDDQDGALAGGEAQHLALDHRVGDVHDVDRHLRAAVDVGQAEPLERAQHRVAVAALDDDADVARAAALASMNSLSFVSSMKRTAAGQRSSIFSRSCA